MYLYTMHIICKAEHAEHWKYGLISFDISPVSDPIITNRDVSIQLTHMSLPCFDMKRQLCHFGLFLSPNSPHCMLLSIFSVYSYS